MNGNLGEQLDAMRVVVEARLDRYLAPRQGFPESLREAVRYSLLAPGKRLRPMLVMLACEACDGTEERALPAAAAVEMVHTYSLIHDDLPAMDDDDLRRGRPTCHKVFGEAMAILAGDALLTMAFEVLADGYPPDVAGSCCGELARAAGAAGMVGGQVDDMASEMRNAESTIPHSAFRIPNSHDLEFLHARKTGALFRGALRMGVWAAKGKEDATLLNLFDAYGRSFGLAFQITDDLLDVEGKEDQTGKRVQKDAGRGKLTYPGLLGVPESRRRANLLCQDACRHLEPLGAAGDRLAQLARLLLERDR